MSAIVIISYFYIITHNLSHNYHVWTVVSATDSFFSVTLGDQFRPAAGDGCLQRQKRLIVIMYLSVVLLSAVNGNAVNPIYYTVMCFWRK